MRLFLTCQRSIRGKSSRVGGSELVLGSSGSVRCFRVSPEMSSRTSGGKCTPGWRPLFYCIQWPLLMHARTASYASTYTQKRQSITWRMVGVKMKMKLKLKLYYDRQSVGQSVLVSGAHLGDLWPIFLSPWNFLQTVTCFYSALSDERTGL
jgi:hypothetical protein